MLFKKIGKLPAYEGEERVDVRSVNDYVTREGERYVFTPPDWIEDLIIVEANIAKVTKEGTVAAGTQVLDHLAQMGVNGLWLTPIFDNEGNANKVSHYGNRGPHTFGADCFRATSHEKRKKELRRFIKEAHRRNIYVFIDVVTYGALVTSPMYQAYINGEKFEGMDVSDWFTGKPAFSGYRYDWKSRGLREWFADRMVDLIKEYGFDGFRVDSEPSYLWFDGDGDGVADTYADIFTDVRLRVAGFEKDGNGGYVYPRDGEGRKLVIFSEKNNLREYAYDFEQMGVIHYGEELTIGFQLSPETRKDWFFERDMVSSVKQGNIADGRWFTERLKVGENFKNCFKYYSYCLSNHDTHSTFINKRLSAPLYQAIFAPFIPIWYYGEECGFVDGDNAWLNSKSINIRRLLSKKENRAFYKKFKKGIRIRRKYPELFRVFPDDIRDTNLAHVDVSDGAVAYSRYCEDKMAIIAARPKEEGCEVTLSFEWKCKGTAPHMAEELISGRKYPVTSGGNRLTVSHVPIDGNGVIALLLRISC